VTLGLPLGLDRLPGGERGDDLGGDRAGSSAPRPFTTRLVRDPSPGFIGRSSEIERLVRTLRFASGPVALVSGTRGAAGQGKSELCCRVASELCAVLPLQVWVDLRSSTEQPLRPEQAVERVLRFLAGPLARLPSEPEAQLALYRSKLSGQRALIIADDIRDGATIRALLPPPGCALLANSRGRIPLNQIGIASSYTLDLDGLPPSESSQLLRNLCPRLTSSQASELSQRCAQTPLALQLAGHLLREDVRRTPAELIAQIDGERARLESVRPGEGSSNDILAVIAVASRTIDPWSRQVLSHMAVLPLPFDGETLTAIAALPAYASPMLDVLRRLGRSGLLEFDAQSGLYRMHEQVRQYALSQGEPGLERTVRDLHAAHLIHVLEGAEARAHLGNDALADALALFDNRRAHIEAAQAWVATTPTERPGSTAAPKAAPGAAPAPTGTAKPGGPPNQTSSGGDTSVLDPQLRRYAALARASGGLLAQRLPAKARQRWLEGALAAARRLGDRSTEAALLLHTGHLQRELGQSGPANESYAGCLALARTQGERPLAMRAEASLAHSHAETGQVGLAIPHFESALSEARKLGDLRSESALLASLGIAQLEAGQTTPAIAVFEQDLAVAARLGDKRAEGRALGNLGLAYRLAGQALRAIDFYDQHIAIARTVSDRRGEANSAWNRALALESLGRREEAIAAAEQALRLREAIADPRAEKVRAALTAWRQVPGT
jgi:tetratricopeptide (TPR) repeat protein